ncbi:FMN-binding negative transcriptional regulator [Pedobacter chitinilyticus]|uniref:FMN-binding negative transcriptional regulator n=1 Tax=Pedobacter chitinilyticus TaxID=2233776 RepID=A0A443YRD5_9SPHI|nr:FMN-binding negative transcriptional regulator [Pedobacter chitinilyticus]RWU06354.1 FMN-binding negative transcriptional regulator [Pedobacter chitinilyticus]
MYKVGHFLEKDTAKLIPFIQAHPFAVLIGANNHIPSAAQIPLQVKIVGDEIKLIGHVMRKTDHHLAFAANENVLALFQGAHAYVSASVYENPASASTWNYSSVQVRGTIKLLDEAGTRKAIEDLTNQYEKEHSPAAFHQMSEEYIAHHLKAIVGVEITVTELEGVFKLSQNHSEANKEKIIDYLLESDDVQAHEVAEQMRKGN